MGSLPPSCSRPLLPRSSRSTDLFYTRIHDFQTELFNPATDIPVAANAPFVTTEGVEANFFGRPWKDFTLNGGVIYDAATYGPLFTTNEIGLPVNVQGRQLAGAPKWKVTVAGEYSRDLGRNLQSFVSADLVYTSAIDFAEFADPLQETGDHAIVGARLGVRSADKHWSIAVFARNLFDDREPPFLYAPYLLASVTAPGITTQGRSYSIDSFRLVGVSLDGRF